LIVFEKKDPAIPSHAFHNRGSLVWKYEMRNQRRRKGAQKSKKIGISRERDAVVVKPQISF